MRLSFKLALMNIRRYPLRTLGSAVCLLLFSFALFSAGLFTRSLSDAVSELLKSRSSGNVVVIKTDIDELENIEKCPYILEARPHYWGELADSSYIEIDGMGKFETDLFYEQYPDAEELIPKTYLEEYRAIGGNELLVAGRMPECSGEMIICESWLKSARIKDYNEILGKPITISREVFDWLPDQIILDNAVITGVFSAKLTEINALEAYNGSGIQTHIGFLLNSESEYNFIEAYCRIDQVDKACEYFKERYSSEDKFGDVFGTTLTSKAMEKLSGLNSFVGNLMCLAAGAVALVYVLIQIIMMANYIREKTLFVTAADAFGCGKSHIFGAFAAENIALLIPISAVSGILSCEFVRTVLGIISAYVGMTLDVDVDVGIVFAAFAVMLAVEIGVVFIGTVLFRRKSND